jgi:glycosyltransferase involved in cell wall biosynthesis
LKAGFLAKELTKKPLVIHIHATEFDRGAGQGVDEYIYQIEREGVARADKVITVSDFVKQRLINNYGAAPEKIEVIHNAVDYPNSERLSYYDSEICKFPNRLKEHYKIVLFLGRLTIQKGPDYFVHAAKLVLEKEPKVLFVMVGDGDMKRRMIEKALYLGIAQNFIFTGFLKEDEVREIYKLADIYVMPSVSEPFGIAPLEALTCGTPVLISKQSGVSEVLKHCLSCDFWDTREMANKILACLKYSELHKSLQENGSREVRKFSWDKVAEKVMGVYRQLCPVTI